MNKSEFIAIIKEVGDFKEKKEAERALNAFVQAVEKVLEANDKVELVGFGKFENAWQKGKKGKIPGSDKIYNTPGKWVPKFKAGKAIKSKVEKIKDTPPKED